MTSALSLPEPARLDTSRPACREIRTRVRLRDQLLPVRGRLVGDAARGVVLAIGGISADRRVCADERGAGWWPLATNPGRALDPAGRAVLSFDFLGEALTPFPSVHDQAEAALAVADAAGVTRFRLVGASYGGAVALAIAARASERVQRVAVLSAAARPDPMASALRSIQREIVRLGLTHDDGAAGLDLARRLAMTTYRTRAEFRDRFDAGPADGRSDVEAYLAARGAEYAARTAPERFLALSISLDAIDLDLAGITAPASFLAVAEDNLFPVEDTRAAAIALGADYVEISSVYGHDAFLKEVELVNGFLEASL